MNIRILQQLNEIKSVRGLAVIIDVFRAFTVEPYLVAGGVKALYATKNTEDAFAFKEKNPDAILVGERQGKIVDGFDFGNSPADIAVADVCGRVAIHTTSAGTLGVASAINASQILVSSLVNARATAKYISESGVKDVSLVCMGLDAKEETEEDTLCARYIKALLEKSLGLPYEQIDWKSEIEILKKTSGAKFFDPNLQDIFKEEDFNRCVEVDKFDFALKATKTTGILYSISIA